MPKKKNKRKQSSKPSNQPLANSNYGKGQKVTVFLVSLALIGGAVLAAMGGSATPQAPSSTPTTPAATPSDSVIGETTITTPSK